MIKLLSGMVIFFGCGYMGIIFSQKYKKRVKALEELQRILAELGNCIEFLGMPIADGLNMVAKNCETEIRYVFMYVEERLKSNPCSNMEGVWRRGLDKYRYALPLTDDDVEILTDFSKTLGQGNREKEKNNIKVALMRLKIAEDEARAENEQNSKMYRGLGFLLGIFVVIVLI